MSSPRPSKRRRIYRACDQCRRRKSKCDGEQPICSICSSAGRDCTYQTGGGRRGLAPGYVRSLEIILGLVCQNVPNTEATIHGILFDPPGKNFFRSRQANNALNAWRNSKLSKNVSHLLSPNEDINDDLDWEPSEDKDEDERMDDEPNSQLEVIETVEVNETTQSALPRSEQVQAPILQQSNPFNIQVPENTPNLLDFYFTYTHCWFPIVERRELLRAMHLGPGLAASGTSSSLILLWSVILYSSIMSNTNIPGLPTPAIIQLSIQQQALANWESLELGHIQAMLMLTLIHIAASNVCLAWSLVGQATRMLLTFSPAAKKHRFTHTFNGAVFLENILSATLGKTPGLPQHEQSKPGPVEEDDVDEWDVWTASRASVNGNRKAPAPLRALSTFNAIRNIMTYLSQILSQPVDLINTNELLHQITMQTRPYRKQDDAHPPASILHLTSTFTILTLIRRGEQILPDIVELCINNVHLLLDLLDHYQEIIGEVRPSPLVYCFALQCQYCVSLVAAASDSNDRENINRRLMNFLQPIQSPSVQTSSNHLHQPLVSNYVGHEDLLHGVAANTSQPLVNESINLQVTDNSAMEISMPPPSQDISTVPVGLEGYDALFEEIVSSFPSSRQEPVFAHNLGFYDGDLDTDFLAHLQHPPAS
ncbi:C6 zinc finger domain protein [Penicillium malachiteum]|uniref:C6 zinc finger domain protein n=1 Tax=Penicillium malachiteum TaxID=1324776 RepID=UPI0025495CC2|nr:C6 zinc finger domain protein [Penicillium malachiteum]KAJ5729458.1 C6 zinc finger domain protein [Penicillium malachiteum]